MTGAFNRHNSVIIFLFFLGFFLRFFNLGDKSLWLDEACSFYQAEKSIPLLIKEAFSYDLHPPLYSTLLHYWIKIGEGEFILRTLSAIFGLLSLIVFYKLSQLILNKEETLVAVSFFTFSSLAIFFSQELRPYSLFLFESILLSYLFLKNVSSKFKGYLLFYILIGVISVYTHLYTSLIFLAHLSYLILFKRDEIRKIGEIIFAIFIVFLLFLPWCPALSSKSYLFKGEWKRGIFFPGLRESLTQFNFCLDVIPPVISLILVSVFVLMIAYKIIWKKAMRKNISFSLLSFSLPLLIILLYPFRIHQFNVKEVIFISPFWYILLAWASSSLKNFYKISVISIWLFANILVLSIYYSPNFIKENWREVAEFVVSEEKKDEAIIFNPSYLGFPFDYYYKGRLPRGKIDAGKETKALREKYSSFWLIESSSYLAQPLRQTRLLIKLRFKEEEKYVWKGYLGDIAVTKFY